MTDIVPYHFILHRIQSHKHWSFPRHRHEDVFEFYYLFEGELSHHFDNSNFVMKEGDFISVQESEHHSLKGKDFDFFNLIIPVSYWETLLDSFNLRNLFESSRKDGRIFKHFKRETQLLILQELEQMFLYQKTEYGDVLLSRFFLNLAAAVLGPPDNHKKRDSDFPLWLDKLILEVGGQMDQQLTVGDLSLLSNKSPEHLSRSFRRFMDTTPSSWLNSQKMERAAHMLEHSNTAVLDIALSLGYDNLGYFYRLFRKHFHMPPVVYRKENAIFQGV